MYTEPFLSFLEGGRLSRAEIEGWRDASRAAIIGCICHRRVWHTGDCLGVLRNEVATERPDVNIFANTALEKLVVGSHQWHGDYFGY